MDNYIISGYQISEEKLPTWHNASNVEFQAKIPVKLDKQALHERSKSMATEVHKLNKKKAEKTELMSELGAQIKMMETKITQLATVVEKGIEDQERPVMWIKNFDTKMKQLVLVDEDIIVGEVPLLINEMQAGLKLE